MTDAERAQLATVTDWHVNLLDVAQSVVFPSITRVQGVSLHHAQCLADAIRQRVQREGGFGNFKLEIPPFRYRLQRISPYLYAARNLDEAVPLIGDLGFRPEHVNLMLADDFARTGGLVVVLGNTGAGKTTTASAMIAARLAKFGGYCLTIEDPPEYNLEGFHGDAGYCEQMDVSDKGYAAALVDALRCFPSRKRSMLLLGEVRAPDDAYQLLQIALNGHLVITTMHGKDIVSGLIRLVSLASLKSSESEIRSMLASSLVLATHQSLASNTPQMHVLRTTESVAAILQNGRLHQLQDELHTQNRTTTAWVRQPSWR